MAFFLGQQRVLTGCDQYGFDPFESSVCQQVSELQIPAMGFISLRHELMDLLKFAAEKKKLLPPFRRIWKSGNVYVTQDRFELVASEHAFFRSPASYTISIPVYDYNWSGAFIFTMEYEFRQLRVMRIAPFEKGQVRRNYPGTPEARVMPPMMGDERSFWERRADSCTEDLTPIAQAVNNIVDQCKFDDEVVIPASSGLPVDHINGIYPPGSYRELLRYANGVVINNLLIFGFRPDSENINVDEGCRWLRIGQHDQFDYVLPIENGYVQDSLHAFPTHGKVRKMNKTVVELCRSALKNK